MTLPPPEPDEPKGGGAPTWMLMYGDTVTLLLTFFVLLLTFSTPEPETFQQIGRGVTGGLQRLGFSDRSSRLTGTSPDVMRLASARLDTAGAEKPPINSDVAIDQLTKYHRELTVDELPDLKGAMVIRIPIGDLFGPDDELAPDGRAALDQVADITRAAHHSIVVRVDAPGSADGQDAAGRSVGLADRVAEYLRGAAGGACEDVGVSDNVRLSRTELRTGQCEITMLEV